MQGIFRSFRGWHLPLALLLLAAFSGKVQAQEWARKMFDHYSHDFGVLVRGQKAEHRFQFKNLYVEDVEIDSVTSTCGCTIPEVTKRLLKTYETSEIVARANTHQFLGHKEATLRVRFRKPFPAEVQLHVYMYIRSDVVFEPGQVNFGTVTAGKGSQAITVTATHLARGDWKIVDVKGPQFLQFSWEELSRQANRTSYQISVQVLPEAPVGYLRESLILVTNDPDPRMRNLTLQVEGVVVPPLSARPSPLMMGLVAPGQKVVRNLVVQAEAPFRITAVELPSEAFTARYPEEASRVQLVVIEFSAPSQPGKITGVIRIKTDLPEQGTLEVPLSGQIVGSEEK